MCLLFISEEVQTQPLLGCQQCLSAVIISIFYYEQCGNDDDDDDDDWRARRYLVMSMESRDIYIYIYIRHITLVSVKYDEIFHE